MCWAEKFCYCVPLNLGCVLLGIFNLIFAISLAITSIIHFASDKVALEASRIHAPAIFQLELTQVPLDIAFGVVLAVALSCMLFSMILILGIIRNKSNFVLAFFFFGILLVIFSNLSALLLILRGCQGCLALSLVIFFFSMLYIHFLVAVYTVYELMQRGRDFRFYKFNNEDSRLLTEEDFN